MKVKILLMGFGNVGRGFSNLLIEKKEMIRERFGIDPLVVGICTRSRGNIYDPSGIDLNKVLELKGDSNFVSIQGISDRLTSLSADEIVERSDFDVLAECTITEMDGKGSALSYIRSALKRGKSVITTNKGPIAFFYKDLQLLAEANGARLLFEGTVMAGTPLFSTSLLGLSGSSISGFEGVLNGTCNFILDLLQKGEEFEEALRQAQERGYAEADPSMDIEGTDTALKAMILSQVLMHSPVPDLGAIEITGISDLDPEYLKSASEKNERIRLIAKGEMMNGDSRISVKPIPLSPDHPLYHLPGAVNGIVLSSDVLGSICLTGAGAGSRETGFALLQDLLSLWGENFRFSSSAFSSK